MRKSEVKAGEWVIKQGALGDRFYIVDSGQFEVKVNHDKAVVTDEADAGDHVEEFPPPAQEDIIWRLILYLFIFNRKRGKISLHHCPTDFTCTM